MRDEIAGEWGAFDVECRDTWAYGVGVRPDEATGWRIVSWEKGPDDDVDAVFSDGRTRSTSRSSATAAGRRWPSSSATPWTTRLNCH